MRIQALLLAAFVGMAMADSPTPSENSQPEASATKDTTTAASQPASPDKIAKPKGVKGDLDPYTADLGELQKAGYKIKKQNGETLYCRKDPETGSRVKTNTICLTREQLKQIESNTRDGMREMTRQPGAQER